MPHYQKCQIIRFQTSGALPYYWNEFHCTSTLTASPVKLCIREGKQGADGFVTASSEITDVHVCSWRAGQCSWVVHYGTWLTGKSWRKPWSSFCGSFWGMWTEAGTFSLKDRQRSLKHNNSFRVCKSVHPHNFNWINQPDVAASQVYYLSFKYSSTCFWHPHAHHQELQQLQ